MRNRLSILIPAYNEEENIVDVLTQVFSVNYKIPFEVVLVNDGSTDRTSELIKNFISSKKIQNFRLIETSRNMGKTMAIKIAIKNSKYEIIIIQDADGEYSPKDIPKLLQPILLNHVSVVFGSRFTGKINSMKLSHRLGNKFLTLMTRILYRIDITDMETGYKAIRREVLDSFTITSSGFLIEPELTAKVSRLGYQIVERPINFIERRKGKKKISWRDGIWALLALIKFRFKSVQ